MKNLILGFVVLALTACAFDKDESTTNTTEERNRDKLLASYESIRATYRGTLTSHATTQDVELELFPSEEEDSAGKKMPILGASLLKIRPVGKNISLTGRYVQETGSIILTSKNKEPEVDEIKALSLKITGQVISGDATSTAGNAGHLEMSLHSRESGNRETAEQEYKNRLREQYQTIAGIYKGNIVPPAKTEKPYPVIMTVLVADITDEKNNTSPQLIGILHRPGDGTNILDMALTMNYRADLNPPQLSITAVPRYKGDVNYIGSLHGTLKDNKYTGSMSSNSRGFEGNFVLTKQP